MLSNNNISLRALEPDDVELLYHWENQAEIWQISNTYAPVSKYVLANYIANAHKDIWETKSLRLAIADLDNKLLGTIELFDFEPYHARAGVGVVVFEKTDRRKGIASDAIELLLTYVRDTLGIDHIFANISADNEASINLFLKLGFMVCGTKKRWVRTGTGWNDEIMMQKFL